LPDVIRPKTRQECKTIITIIELELVNYSKIKLNSETLISVSVSQ